MPVLAAEVARPALRLILIFLIFWFFLFYHKIQVTIKQDSYSKANESDEEAQKETMRLIDIGLPQSKNKVNRKRLKSILDDLPRGGYRGGG